MSLKEILFCQGDIKELERITGKKYVYINPQKLEGWDKLPFRTSVCEREGQNIQGGKRFEAVGPIAGTQILRTFLIGEDKDYGTAVGNLYKVALELKADALIHVSGPDHIVQENAYRKKDFYVVYGTPVKEKKKRV